MSTTLPSKDPENVEPYHIILCDIDGTNDGTASDSGYLQSATISSATWTVPAGITKDSSNQNAVTIAGVSYGADTVATIVVSAGTDDQENILKCVIVTSDGRKEVKRIIIPVRES